MNTEWFGVTDRSLAICEHTLLQVSMNTEWFGVPDSSLDICEHGIVWRY